MLLTGKQKHIVKRLNQIAGERGEGENLILNIEVIMRLEEDKRCTSPITSSWGALINSHFRHSFYHRYRYTQLLPPCVNALLEA